MKRKKQLLITIDGPSGSGKGATCLALSQKLGLAVLDSGAIYRTIAWISIKQNILCHHRLINALKGVRIVFKWKYNRLTVLLYGEDITSFIRNEQCAKIASKLALDQKIRQSIYHFQRAFLRPRGLIADGRDMSTVVFPESNLKIYLDCDPLVRARRRYKEIQSIKKNVSFNDLCYKMQQRDQQDTQRQHAPLSLHQESVTIDNSNLSLQQTVFKILNLTENI